MKPKYVISKGKKKVLANQNFSKFWIIEKEEDKEVLEKDVFFNYSNEKEKKVDVRIMGFKGNHSLNADSKTNDFPDYLRKASKMYNVWPLFNERGCSGLFYIPSNEYLFEGLEIKDEGNINEKDYSDITQKYAECIYENSIPLMVGGDHSITFTITNEIAKQYKNILLFIFDAHNDYKYTMFEEKEINHANFVSCISKNEKIKRIIQIGVRGLRSAETVVNDPKVNWISDEEKNEFDLLCERLKEEYPDSKVYISVDLDVINPSVYPFVDFPVFGGLELSNIKKKLDKIASCWEIVGVDMVEGLPTEDYKDAAVPLTVLSFLLDEIKKQRIKNRERSDNNELAKEPCK